MSFSFPATWMIVGVEAAHTRRRRARARTKRAAMLDFGDILAVHATEGVLSHRMRSVRCFVAATSSVMSHCNKTAAISRSEFVTVPLGLASDTTMAVMWGGHWRRQTTLWNS